jgi:DNA invertase Pin-like site-specific DNA recombinase
MSSELFALRYAGYIRISSEDQIGNFSIEAQRHSIESWVEAQGGTLIAVYVDSAFSGRNTDRPQFQAMRQDAKKVYLMRWSSINLTVLPAIAATPLL